MPSYAVTYVYDTREAERDLLRPSHRAYLRSLLDDGALLASGPWTDGDAGALLLVRADDAASALAALDADPFWTAGLVAQREVRGWNPVLGPWE